MNHINIEKKCIIILSMIYVVSVPFFIMAHYGLYDCYKRIIVCYTMRLRATAYKKKYDNSMVNQEPSLSYVYVNRTLDYLKKNTVLHLKKCGIRSNIQSKTGPAVCIKQKALKKRTILRKKNERTTSNFSTLKSHKGSLFRWPLKKGEFWLSSFFGPRKKPDKSWRFHYGIDMAALKGTLVYAAGQGRVLYAGYQRGYGNTVLIAHADRYTTRYAHLDTIAVQQGARIAVEKCIGTVGDTGYTITRGKDASHLHFEISIRGKQVNPLSLLPT